MSSTSPPPEAQRFGRSQTPESPRPVHIPEPANIPVLLNQMDPVFNDTATYNIPNNQTFSPFPDPTSEQGVQATGVDEHDAVQNFFREAEHQAAADPEPIANPVQDATHTTSNVSIGTNPFFSVSIPERPDAYQEPQSLNTGIQLATATLPNILSDSSTLNKSDQEPQDQREEEGDANRGEDLSNQSQQQDQSDLPSNVNPDGGVDYQSLLDTISQSASTAPAASTLSVPTTTASNSEDVSRPLPSIPGLPPKPPPQEHPVEFPSYSSYENVPAQILNMNTAASRTNDESLQSGVEGQQTVSLVTVSAQGDVPQHYAQVPAFNVYGQVPTPKIAQLPPVQEQVAPGQETNKNAGDVAERPWSPRTQTLYDQFLEDERRYVTEGIWDKFPTGSRLFVGNLPSEKVTKRDLFHKFHKHGQLAQISIKQAYGFVQFLEAASCSAALNTEQGVEIRGRKVHLEISKPQKNTRNAGGGGGSGGGSANKNQQRRRSRSPDRAGRRDSRNYSDFRDEPGRRRDEFRNRRSPSPRGYRQRDEYRSGGRDGRSGSPSYGDHFLPPQLTALDDETALPLPRRDPRQVPDVQLLVLEPEVVQSFINWVEQGFRNKGLQASTIWVHNRFPLPAVIKRQIIEGVQAVVKLTRAAQNNSKIPLQVFDRSGGASNVNFNEYVDLDISVAADLVVQARQKEQGGITTQSYRHGTFSPQTFQSPVQYGMAHASIPYPQQSTAQFPPQQAQPPQYSFNSGQQSAHRPLSQGISSTGQPPNLQQLLANLRQPPSQPLPQNMAAAANGQPPTLSGFLNSIGASQQYSQGQPTAFGQFSASGPQQGGQHPNVQNIMEQLARFQG